MVGWGVCSTQAATLGCKPCEVAILPGERQRLLLYGATHATVHVATGQTVCIIVEAHRVVAVRLTDPPINPDGGHGQRLAVFCDDLLQQGQGQHEPLTATLLLSVELAIGGGHVGVAAMQGAVSHGTQAGVDACLCSSHVGDGQQVVVERVAVVAGLVVAQHLIRLCLATRCQTDLDCNPVGVVCRDGVAGRQHEIDHACLAGLLAHLLALLGLGAEGVVSREIVRAHVARLVDVISIRGQRAIRSPAVYSASAVTVRMGRIGSHSRQIRTASAAILSIDPWRLDMVGLWVSGGR